MSPFLLRAIFLVAQSRFAFGLPDPPPLGDEVVAKWGAYNNWPIRWEALPPPALRADFNGDGVVNSQDLFDFLDAWNRESNGGTPPIP